MNQKWSEKTNVQKVADVISCIALCVWVILGILERTNVLGSAEMGKCIAIGVICVCEAISFWNVKRGLSYVAVIGLLCMVAAIVLQAL